MAGKIDPPPEIDLPSVNLDPDYLSVPKQRKEETEKLVQSFKEFGFCKVW